MDNTWFEKMEERIPRGEAVTPGGAVEICHILGRAETLARIDKGIEKLEK